MQHTKKLFISRPMLGRACLSIVSLFAAGVLCAQKDTTPVKKSVLDRINRVISGNKDTVKPKDPNADRNVIPGKEINPNKEVTPNREIIDNNRIAILTRYPDTLNIGSYSIVVEAYDKGGTWNELSKSYLHLNGIGRIKFNCPPLFTIFPGIWKTAVMKTVKFRVVENQDVKENEISTKDAADLGLTTQPGSEVELVMPHFNDRAIPMSRYLGDLKGIKIPTPAPEGIRVRFTDITASVTKAGATKGLVLSGIAAYPTTPAIPAAPFSLNIASGFSLEVSAISFSPGMDPTVTARLILPSSLTANTACAPGSLNLGNFRLSPTCEFYKELPDSDYGIFGVGNTTLAIQGHGYVVDFSSSQTYGPVGKPISWKGVILNQGESKGSPPGTTISNIGYLQADYTFFNGIIESSGLTATFQLASAYNFGTTQPLGYVLHFNAAEVNVASSTVTGGFLRNGGVVLPNTAVRQANDDFVKLEEMNLTINSSMDLSGFAIVKPTTGVYWGDLIAAGGGDRKSFGAENITRQVLLFFSARPRAPFNPTNATGKKFNVSFASLTTTIMDSYNMQGAVFGRFGLLVVNTANIPSPQPPNSPKIPANSGPVWFSLPDKDFNWINVVTEGVHCSISGDIVQTPVPLKYGDPTKPLYVGVTSFDIMTSGGPRTNNIPISSILLQCVESAVITCDYRAIIKVPDPVSTTLAFKEMVFTSTANNAGGKLVIGSNDSLSYWGLKLVPKPGFSSAGLVCVKTGQIILTAAGLSETRHFAQPFWLTWGEMLANGSMGRLFFDYNSAGQQFDKFNYIHDAVQLSPIDPDPAKRGFLRVGGMAFFPFFGADYLHIIDTYTPGMSGDPFNGRTVTLSSGTTGAFSPTDFTIGGNWSDGLGIFNFTIQYAAITQDGFLGVGMSALRNLIGGDIGSTLDMNSRGTCIRIGTNLLDMRSVSLGPVANISQITRIWGCICVKDDGLENLVVGGEVTNSASFSIVARVGSYLSVILQVNPSLARVTIDGEATVSLVAEFDAVINGHMQLTMNFAEGFLEGEISGKVRLAEGNPILASNSLQAEGQLNWHVGIDFFELQGMVALRMMSSVGIPGLGAGAGTGVSAAFYIGKNAPKSRAWVLIGGDPRFSLNTSALPERLTGIYGSLHVEQGINLFIISGGYEITVGLGAFQLEPAGAAALGALAPVPGLPYVIGNLGGRIHGEILGGLVSAGAWFDLQVIGPYPFGFEGRVGLEACVLWVACGSVDVTIGLNTSEGFYIR